jgi:peptidoglycan/xylan/chitin deacetylase (PgdA/CDA1 family)
VFQSASVRSRAGGPARPAIAVCAWTVAALWLFAAAPTLAAPAFSAPILAYHRFDARQAGPTTVRDSTFLDQLNWLEQRQYVITPLRTLVDQLDGRAPPPSAPEAAITVDDGHVSVFTDLFPVIRQRRIPVTLFIYPSAISNAPYAMTWAQLREMQASGLVDVQSHTYWHPNFRTEKKRRPPADYQAFVAQQLAKSRSVLEARLGRPVTMLAWPYGIVDPELEAAARRAGYVAGFDFAGGQAKPAADLLSTPRIPIADGDLGSAFAAKIGVSNRAVQP